MKAKDAVYLHIGMPKSGSTAVQRAFAAYDDGILRYAQLGDSNHSEALITLAEKYPEKFHTHRSVGRAAKEVEALRIQWERKFSQELSGTTRRLVFSAEALCEAGPDALVRLKRMIDPYATLQRCLAYIRDPISFASSVFQQAVKQDHPRCSWHDRRIRPEDATLMVDSGFGTPGNGPTRSNDHSLLVPLPFYRRKFEKFLRLWGDDNVELVPFDRNQFLAGSLVNDLSIRLGVPPVAAPNDVRNERLSGELVSLLYFWNRCGMVSRGEPNLMRARWRLIELLAPHFPGIFRLDNELVLAAQDFEDVAWMQDRGKISKKLTDYLAPGKPDDVATEKDLLCLYDLAVPRLRATMRRLGIKFRATEDGTTLLDRVYLACMHPENSHAWGAAVRRRVRRQGKRFLGLLSSPRSQEESHSEAEWTGQAVSRGYVFWAGFNHRRILPDAFTVLFIGNSLTAHPGGGNVWDGVYGMAATSRRKDFVHQFVRRLHDLTAGRPVEPFLECGASIADAVERIESGVLPLTRFDLIVVQKGENDKDFDDAFRWGYTRLMDLAAALGPVIGVSDWYHAERTAFQMETCERIGAAFLDIREIAADPRNSGYAGPFAHPGVATHPNDRGMTLIAHGLWAVAKSMLCGKSASGTGVDGKACDNASEISPSGSARGTL